MGIAALIDRLTVLDVRLTIVFGRLQVDAPHGALSDDDREDLRQRKAEILATLYSLRADVLALAEARGWPRLVCGDASIGGAEDWRHLVLGGGTELRALRVALLVARGWGRARQPSSRPACTAEWHASPSCSTSIVLH